jgi:hypothetical protein
MLKDVHFINIIALLLWGALKSISSGVRIDYKSVDTVALLYT